ncbi:MAG TPA: MFS transporter [Streptosporangiaceae bacterium]
MSTRTPAQVQGPVATGGYPRRWFAAAAMTAAVLMDMIDVTIVNVALPTIRHDLGASATQLEWVVSAYMLAFAAVLITAGSLGDLFGRKRLFLAGIAVFGLASLGAGLSQTAGQLIAARVVQGAAAALMTPQLLATFRTMFSGRERGQAFGIYGAVLGFASAVGLLLGGVLTSANLFGWGWRSVFFVNIPIALASLAGSARLMPENRERSAGRVDFAGAILLTGALVAIAYPLLEGRSLGWPAWCWVMLGAGIVGLGLLGLIEARRQHTRIAPLLRTPLFRIPAFTIGLLVQLAFGVGIQGFFLVFTLWVQTGQHYSPLRAGLTAVAFSVGSFALAPQAAPLARRFGRLVLALGGLLFAAGIIGVDVGAHHVGTGTNPWPLVPGLVVAGAGLSLLVIPLVNVVLAAVPAEAAGGASGLFSTAQQLGGAIGVAVAGAIFFGDLGRHSFQAAFVHTAPYAAGALLICAVLSLTLPRTAGEDEGL